MKTKEEIERLAKQLCNIPIDLVIDEEERYYKNLEKYDGIIQGYTQCQEDNKPFFTEETWNTMCSRISELQSELKNKKYTEEDIRKVIDETIKACNISQKQSYGDLEIDTDKIINSLNKQDK